MLLLVVIKVEAIVVSRNWNLVEKELEVCIVVLRVEEFFECNILQLRKSVEPIHEEQNVDIARILGREGIEIANFELASLSDLGILSRKPNGPGVDQLHLHRSSTSHWQLLMQCCNLYKKVSVDILND